MNYLYAALGTNMDIEQSETVRITNQIAMESARLLNQLETTIIVLEAEGDNTSNANSGTARGRARDMMNKFIAFITRIFDAFMEKVRTLTNRDRQWLASNADAIRNLNYSNMSIEMVPFWKVKMTTVVSNVKGTYDSMTRQAGQNNAKEDLKDIENVKRQMFSLFLDGDGNLTNGSLNLFRTGNKNNSDPVTIRGNELQGIATGDMLSYCQSYGSQIQSSLKSMVDSSKTKLNSLERTLQQRTASNATEAFLDDSILFKDDDFFPQSVIVLEADNDNRQTARPANTQSNKDQTSATAVKVNADRDRDAADTREVSRSASTDQLTIMRNIAQCANILMASALTASEERYVAYMTALRQFAAESKRGNKGNTTEDNNGGNQRSNRRI